MLSGRKLAPSLGLPSRAGSGRSLAGAVGLVGLTIARDPVSYMLALGMVLLLSTMFVRKTIGWTGPVERSSLVKGYEFEKGQYVLLTNDEIASVKLESTKTIDIERFVDALKLRFP